MTEFDPECVPCTYFFKGLNPIQKHDFCFLIGIVACMDSICLRDENC